MALGKTIQTINILPYLNLKNKNFTLLIIVPKVQIKKWEREINEGYLHLKFYYFMVIKKKEKF